MPRDDDRYDDDDRDDRPRRRGGVSGGGGSTVLYVLLGLGLVGVLGCGGLVLAIVIQARKAAKEFGEAIEKAKIEMRAGPPVASVTVAGLGKEYAGNVAAADAKYNGKSIRVDGVVEAIDGDADSGYTVRLAPSPADPAGLRVVAEFDEDQAEAVAGFVVGQRVLIVGRCGGRETDDPDDEDAPKPKAGKSKYVVRLYNCRRPEPTDAPPPADAPPKPDDGKREKAPSPKKPPQPDDP